jgi:hypothetical protein
MEKESTEAQSIIGISKSNLFSMYFFIIIPI